MSKYIFVTGGVSSALGKGITASSIGKIFKEKGYSVFMQKFDPYLNIDPGTMSPLQHGEVFVTADGAETDLDLGHYERFIDEELSNLSNITTGKIYSTVLEKERAGKYDGKTVQIVPHITDEIIEKITSAGTTSKADIVITEIGGTVGDIESLPFTEALRQFNNNSNDGDVIFVHVTLVPYINAAGELKTKPTQNSVKSLRSLGIQPDILVCRCEKSLDEDIKSKIAQFTNIKEHRVFEAKDAKSIFHVPQNFEEQGMGDVVAELLRIENKKTNMKEWNEFVTKTMNIKNSVEIALVGKYTELHDAYLSVSEALSAAGWNNDYNVNIRWIDSEKVTSKNIAEKVKGCAGILVPGGFGERGIPGMIEAIKYARENKIPYLGICLGMQLASIEFARNVCDLKDADSTEWNEQTKDPIIYLIKGTTKDVNLGGTLRLGNYQASLTKGSLAHKLYNNDICTERHRHRYEFNNNYKSVMSDKGMSFSGINVENDLVEIVELNDHPFFIATQAHPEFTSRPNKPNSLFNGFIKASINKL